MHTSMGCSILLAFATSAAAAEVQSANFPFMDMISKPQEQLNRDFAKHFKQLDANFASSFRGSTGQSMRGVVDGMASTEVVFGNSCPRSMDNYNTDEPYNVQAGLGDWTSCDSWTRLDFDKYADSFRSKLSPARLSELQWKYCDLLHRSQQAQEWPEYNRKICRLMHSFKATVASENVLSPLAAAAPSAGALSTMGLAAGAPSAVAQPSGLGSLSWALFGCVIIYFFFPSFALVLISAAWMRLKTFPQHAESAFNRLDEALVKNAASEPTYITIPSIGSVWQKLKSIPVDAQSALHRLDGSLEMNGASEPPEPEAM